MGKFFPSAYVLYQDICLFHQIHRLQSSGWTARQRVTGYISTNVLDLPTTIYCWSLFHLLLIIFHDFLHSHNTLNFSTVCGFFLVYFLLFFSPWLMCVPSGLRDTLVYGVFILINSYYVIRYKKTNTGIICMFSNCIYL